MEKRPVGNLSHKDGITAKNCQVCLGTDLTEAMQELCWEVHNIADRSKDPHKREKSVMSLGRRTRCSYYFGSPQIDLKVQHSPNQESCRGK